MRKMLLDQSSGGTGNILRKFLALFVFSLIVISAVLIAIYGARNIYYSWSGTSTIVLSGQVFQVTERGNLALKDATVSIMHDGERIMDTTNDMGKFHIQYESHLKGSRKERIVVNYPQFETIGTQVEINYNDGTNNDSLVFQLGSLATNTEEVNKIRKEIHNTHLDFIKQNESLVHITDSLKQTDNEESMTNIMERLINQHRLNTRFLMDDSLLFSLKEISADRMKLGIRESRDKQQRILEVKDSLLKQISK